MASWRICGKSPNLNPANITSCTIALSHYAEALTIAKFKIRQCILMTDSLAKTFPLYMYCIALYMYCTGLVDAYIDHVNERQF